MPEELYAKPSLVVSNSVKGPSQASEIIISVWELQNHLTLFKRWINTLFNIKFCLNNDTLMPFNATKLYTPFSFLFKVIYLAKGSHYFLS